VVFRGIDFALALGKNPKPVVIACAFHDIARTTDGPDMMHAENAVPIAEKIMANNLPVPQLYKDAIIYAVQNHTIGKVAPDYVSACLWDADRTRLAWECGFDPVFFATDRAKQIASGDAEKYLQFMNQCMSVYAHNVICHLDKRY